MAWWSRRKAETDSTPDPTLPLIRLEGVSKIFKGDADEATRALDEVTVDIGRGEFVSVSGPSGCGKSTFLSILALLDTPSLGRYWFQGRRVDTLAPAEKARVRNVDIGLIFQSFNLIGDMTVYENVEYPLTRALAGRPPIVLADEPTGNLDSKSGEAVMQMLRELHADGATLCLATHNPDYIAMAQRHVYLFDGRVMGEPTS
jgi:putative ABC transport system ATP-binding protein